MRYPGFIGPTYTGLSPLIDGERCVNLYPEKVESAGGRNQWVLIGTPGLTPYVTLSVGIGFTQGPIQGLFTDQQSGRCFAVSNGILWEIVQSTTESGIFPVGQQRGSVGGGALISMASNGSQLAVATGPQIYILNLNSSTAMAVEANQAGLQILMTDAYFVTFAPGSAAWQISALSNGISWSALDVQEAETGDGIVAIALSHREVWVFGQSKTTVYEDAGIATFPFAQDQGAAIEVGCAATFSVANTSEGLIWLGADVRGNLTVWHSIGYQPVRVSNHAVEEVIQSYGKVSDAYSWIYQQNGHEFYVVTFPSANSGNGATWVYDLKDAQWHERMYWNVASGQGAVEQAHLGCCHCFAFGKHLVGDRTNGNVYVLDQNANQDYNGTTYTPLVAIRTAPHMDEESRWIAYHSFQLDCQVGSGPEPPLVDGNGNPRDPQIIMIYSNDGGFNWSNEKYASLGASGNTLTRVKWWTLGRSRNRSFGVKITDPVPRILIDAFLTVTPGEA